MDKHIRNLDREAAGGDPEAAQRVARLRCRVEGCLCYIIDNVHTWYIPSHLRTSIVFCCVNGHTIITYIKDNEIMMSDYDSIRDRMAATALKLAHCSRCGESNDQGEIHLKKMFSLLSGFLG